MGLRRLAGGFYLGLVAVACAQVLGLEDGTVQGACETAADCAPGYGCMLERCRLECGTDDDCGARSVCVGPSGQRVCVGVDEGCGNGCGNGTECVDGACRTPCSTQADCAGGQECENDFCVSPNKPVGSGGSGGTGGGGTGGTGGKGGTTQTGNGGEAGDLGGGTPGQGGSGGSGGSSGRGGMSGAGGSGGGGVMLGQPCESAGDLACQTAAGKLSLICTGGVWEANVTCSGDQNCDGRTGSCADIVAECVDQSSGHLFCRADVLMSCGPDLVTAEEVTECEGRCVASEGSASCAPATCGDGVVQPPEECDDENDDGTDDCTNACKEPVCGDGDTWQGEEECDNGTTNDDYLPDACRTNCLQARCGDGVRDSAEACDDGDTEGEGTPCAADCTAHTPPPSCAGLVGNECGSDTDDCCTTLEVPGGSFPMGEPDALTASVRSFYLDKYEVVLHRFYAFLGVYESWRNAGNPSVGAGAHPLIEGSGWQADFDEFLPNDVEAVQDAVSGNYATYPNSMRTYPINRVNWYFAFAFCIWDNARLPTEAEWEYAAVGGTLDRSYPWGEAEVSTGRAWYEGSFQASFAKNVGTRTQGIGAFGHHDLAGLVAEWTLDWQAPLPTSCDNCANLTPGTERGFRGGHSLSSEQELLAARRDSGAPNLWSADNGIRCARNPTVYP